MNAWFLFSAIHISATLASAEVTVESLGVGTRQPDLDDLEFQDDLVFQEDISHKLECLSICLKHASCSAFALSPMQSSSLIWACRGHGVKVTLANSKVTVVGSRSYYMTRLTSVSPWLSSTCTQDSDCPEANSECFKLLCLCTPGYYYSHSQDSCVSSCSAEDLDTSFLRYPERHIRLHNIYTVRNCQSVEQCQQECLQNPLCRSMDLEKSTCWLQEDTALSAPTAFEERLPSVYYQRTCR